MLVSMAWSLSMIFFTPLLGDLDLFDVVLARKGVQEGCSGVGGVGTLAG